MPGINEQALTRYLAEFGKHAHSVDDEGNTITREQALAEMLWKLALGFTEKVRDVTTGQWKEVYRPPVSWAIQYVFDRRDGKVAQAQAEETGKIRAADKVRSLARDRLNSLVVSNGPPRYKK